MFRVFFREVPARPALLRRSYAKAMSGGRVVRGNDLITHPQNKKGYACATPLLFTKKLQPLVSYRQCPHPV